MRAKKRATSPQFFSSDCTLDLFSEEQRRKNLVTGGPPKQQKWPREIQNSSPDCLLFVVLALASLWLLNGCAGLVSGTTTSPSSTTLDITNVQAMSTTTDTTQVVWTTNIPANSSVDYGTTSSYGTSTPVDSAMVTSHQVTISGLSAGTTYYYQVQSTDSKSNHGNSGGHKFATAGVNISGTITPTKGGGGATVKLSGASSATTTANGSGAYTFTGLPSGSYGVTPSNAGYSFTPASQNVSLTSTSMTAVNFTATATAVSPTITTQPANQTVAAGQTATFTVVASGTTPLSYQWQKNGASISGATASSYTTPATTTADSGSTFAVVVSNTAGTATSSAATLTVNAAAVAPAITTQPANQTVTAGQTATFTVVASGTTPLSYQWQKNGASISGATASSYTTPATTTADSGSTFRVVVTNTAGTATSNAATLTVNPAPAPAIQVSSTSINFGNDVVGTSTSQSLIVTNTGTATLSISQISASPSAFSVSGFSLPLSVNAGQQTTITVAFVPTAVGSVSGSISIVSNAPTSPTSVSLSGSGIAAIVTLGINPTSLSYGSVTTGTSSAPQTVTVANTGNANVTISSITLSGAGYSMTGGNAPVTLTPSQSLTLSVVFDPTAAGTANGSISIASNATGSPATVTLSGTGVTPVQHSVALNWNASTSTVSGYNVYRSTVSGSGYVKVNSTLVTGLTYTDSNVQSATTYYYVATAVDSTGSESVFSNEASAAIP
jgi:HYDIN/CFA65/VesB family protein/centrosomal CEP192-like protein/Ig-like domain-containing protein